MIKIFKKKIKKIYLYIIKKIFDIIYGELKTCSKYDQEINKVEIFFGRNSEERYNVYKVNNVRLYSDLSQNVAIIKKNFILKEISTQLKDNYLIEHSKNNIINTGTRKLIQKKFKGRTLSLLQGISGMNNYAHWLIDIFGKLFIANEYAELMKYDYILFPSLKKKFQKDTLGFLNYDKNRMIDGSKIKHLFLEELIVPQHPYWKLNEHQFISSSKINKEILIKIKEFFLKKIIDEKKFSRKIFIDRSDSNYSHNKLINNIEIIEFLKKRGFDVIKLSNLSFVEQVNLFRNCKKIISPHGAGLSNIIFCNKGANIIELYNPKYNCEMYKNISEKLELQHSFLKCFNKFDKNGDIILDIETLKKKL